MSELDRFPLLYESYSKSAELYVTAERVATKLLIVLWKMDGTTETERAEGKTYPVGTVIRIRTQLQTLTGVNVVGRTVDFYYRLDTGTVVKLGSKATDASGIAQFDYTMAAVGKHTVYTNFAGDTAYVGCEEGSFSFAY